PTTARISPASPRSRPKTRPPPPTAATSTGSIPAAIRPSKRRSRTSRTTRSPSPSGRRTAGTSCSSSAAASSTTPTSSSAAGPRKRFAKAASTKRLSCGCAGCATKRTSSTSSDRGSDGRSDFWARPSGAGAPVRPLIPRVALTSGEPAGVGPELCLAIAREKLECQLVCLADRALLAARASVLKSPIAFAEYDANVRALHAPDRLEVLHLPLGTPSTPGRLDRANARYVLDLIDRAIDGAVSG